MIKFEQSIFINRSPEEVFDYMSDPTNDMQWRDSAISAEWTSQAPHGVGSTVRSVDKIMGRKMESTAEITAWERPTLWGQKSLEGPMPFEMTVRFEGKEQGSQLTLTGSAQPGGFFKLAKGLVRKQLLAQLEADLNGLKRVLEAR